MDKARTLIVTATAWLSFLANLWLVFFNVLNPWTLIASALLVIIAFGFAAVK
jgi:hypothetical protein